MDIKQLKPKANSRYKQGYFDKYSPKKYIGSKPIIYRSSLELQYMLWLERCPDVLEWGSEITVIPYIDASGKPHNYYMDFTVKLKSGITMLVEVKPQKDIPLNEAEIRMSPVKAKNYYKWNAAIEYANAMPNTKFIIITEKFFK